MHETLCLHPQLDAVTLVERQLCATLCACYNNFLSQAQLELLRNVLHFADWWM